MEFFKAKPTNYESKEREEEVLWKLLGVIFCTLFCFIFSLLRYSQPVFGVILYGDIDETK